MSNLTLTQILTVLFIVFLVVVSALITSHWLSMRIKRVQVRKNNRALELLDRHGICIKCGEMYSHHPTKAQAECSCTLLSWQRQTPYMVLEKRIQLALALDLPKLPNPAGFTDSGQVVYTQSDVLDVLQLHMDMLKSSLTYTQSVTQGHEGPAGSKSTLNPEGQPGGNGYAGEAP